MRACPGGDQHQRGRLQGLRGARARGAQHARESILRVHWVAVP